MPTNDQEPGPSSAPLVENDAFRAGAEWGARFARQTWCPIETAPKDGSHILVCLADASMTVGRFRGERWGLAVGWAICEDDDPEPPAPTHWMPLPSPPTPATETGES
jgi:hypothetical protein